MSSIKAAQLLAAQSEAGRTGVKVEDGFLANVLSLDVCFKLPSDHGIDMDGSVALLVDCGFVPLW